MRPQFRSNGCRLWSASLSKCHKLTNHNCGISHPYLLRIILPPPIIKMKKRIFRLYWVGGHPGNWGYLHSCAINPDDKFLCAYESKIILKNEPRSLPRKFAENIKSTNLLLGWASEDEQWLKRRPCGWCDEFNQFGGVNDSFSRLRNLGCQNFQTN